MISLFKTTKIISVKLIDRKESVMKKNIHPEYKFVVFEDTSNGEKFFHQLSCRYACFSERNMIVCLR